MIETAAEKFTKVLEFEIGLFTFLSWQKWMQKIKA